MSLPSREELENMSGQERNELFNQMPILHDLLRELARAEAGTDVDVTSDMVAAKLEGIGVPAEDRNELVARLVDEVQRVYPKRSAEATLKESVRLLDLMWLGALVHEYRDLLFPKEGS